ncbi:MAG TPA: prepilin-type N-terminal cleavage/methylation domain-containing protein [Lacipirellulaceae bacterium]|nr:prepilin-type N-terminal cleavage/methylation domain-containing protein [Lacipirellulaceae bacterium]
MGRNIQNSKWGRKHASAFSLTELMAVMAILGVLAILIVPRVSSHQDTSKRAACYANQGDIELQVKLWKRANGTYPAANLSDIGANTTNFPSGLPVCPVDGTPYTINTTTGLVNGHTH